jgi:hypothetical protein
MSELKEISNSFERTLKDSDLQNVTIDIAEAFTDVLLKDGLLKEIPIIGTIIGLTKSTITLVDRLYLKKILYFLTNIKNIDPNKREKLINEIENSEKQRIKVGEKLLYIIDKCEDHLTASYIAKLFNAFLKEEISYPDFLRGSIVIQKMFIEDFEQFIKTDSREIEKTITKYDSISDLQNNLISAGICCMLTNNISVSDQWDYKQTDKYIVEGGEIIISFTGIGSKLKKVFK